MSQRLAVGALRGLAARLSRRPALARRLLPLPRLAPTALRSRLYHVFSWPLGEHLRGQHEISTAGGRMLVETEAPFGRVLAVSGVWEPHVTAAFRGRLMAGDVCIDVGAHAGYYSLLASRLVGPGGHVYALEPAARLFRALSSNLARNGCANVTALQVAAGETGGTAILHEAPGPSPLTSSLSPRMLVDPHGGRAEEFVASRVTVVTVEDVVPRELWPRVRAIKIDVEGYEVEVLRGLERLLAVARPVAVFVETSPEWSSEDPAAFLTELCTRHALTAHLLRNEYTLDGFFPRRIEPPARVAEIPPGRRDLMLVGGRARRDA